MSRTEKTQRSGSKSRLNWKALVATTAVIGLLILGGVLLSGFRGDRVRGAVLEQVRDLEQEGKPDLALRHINRYLETRPDDIAVLELQARLLTETAYSADRVVAAIQANERLLRIDPEPPQRQENRRRLIELYLLLSEGYRSSELTRLMPELATGNQRYRAAVVVARDRIKRGAVDPDSRRLLAMALEGLARAGDQKALEEALGTYESLRADDPVDVVSAERLARLYLELKEDPEQARRVLDALLEAAPESSEARLAAHRFYLLIEEPARAGESLEEAARLAPLEDVSVRLAVIVERLRQGRVAEARRSFEALPAAVQEERTAAILHGMIELAEQQPDRAIRRWQELLLASGGIDIGLTWTLAQTLLQVGRVEEALPLLEQFRRLGGEPAEPLYRYLRALASEQQGHLDRAIEDLQWAESRIEAGQRGEVLIALGRCQAALGQIEEASASFRMAQEISPNSSTASLARIESLLGDRPGEAIAELEQSLARNPDSPELRLALAKLHLREQLGRPVDRRDWAEFDRALAEATEVTPESPELKALQAERLAQQGQLDAAIDALEQVVAQSPRSEVMWKALAENLVRAGQAERALEVLDRALAPEALGIVPSFLIAKASLLASQGRGRDAAEVLTQGASQIPADRREPVLAALGRFYAGRGARTEARSAYLEWDRLDPEAIEPKLALLGLALADGQEPAIQEALQALRGSSERPPIAWKLGRAEYLLRTTPTPGGADPARDRLNEATQLIESALAESPNLAGAYRLKATVLEHQGDLEGAAEAYQHAWDRGEIAALRPLIHLLVSLDRVERLERLERAELATLAGLDPDRLAAEAFLQRGQLDQVRRFMDRAVQASPDASTWAWQTAMLSRLGDSDEVEAALLASIERQPTDLSPRRALIRFLAASNRLEEASRAVDEALKQAGDDPPPTLEAELRQASGDLEGAHRAFAEAIAQHPDNPAIRLAAAQFYEETGRPDEAEAALVAALQQEPGHHPAARQLALLISSRSGADLSAWQRAWQALGPESARESDPSPENRLTRAIVLAGHPDPERRNQAIPVLEALTDDLPPENTLATLAREALVRLLITTNRPERAVEVASISPTIGPDLGALILYIEALLAAGRVEEGDRQLNQLARLAPNHPAGALLRVRLIEARAGAESVSEALERAYLQRVDSVDAEPFGRAVVARLLQLGPETAETAETIGLDLAERFPTASWLPARLLAEQGRIDEALQLCRAVVEAEAVRPADVLQASQIVLAVAADSAEGPPGAAVEILETAVQRRPDEPGPRTALAMIRHLQGQYDEEVRLYRELLAKEPSNDLYRNNLAWALSEGLDQPTEALELIEESIRRQGRVPQLLDTRGAILTRLDRLDEAIDDLREASRQMPAGSHHFRLARAYHKAGRIDEARASMTRALQVGLSAHQVEPFEREDFLKLSKL
ncbi:hypothetical protein BH23PLA1_BH23PLA1_02290 [soil metagenome]